MNDTALLPLFDQSQPTAPYRRDSETSLAAAVKVTPSMRERYVLILRAIDASGPMNADECARAIGQKPHQIRPRFTDLHGDKKALFYLESTGIKRPSDFGNDMLVYDLSAKGREYLRQDHIDSRHGANVQPSASAA